MSAGHDPGSGLPTHLDLTTRAIFQHFAQSTRSAQLLTFLITLDRVDTWAVDYDESKSPSALDIQLFVQDVQRVVNANVGVLHHVPGDVMEILARLKSSRCMYLLRYIAHRNPEFIEQLAHLLETDNRAGSRAIKQRLDAFKRAKLLGEIFSGARLTRITQVMGSYADA